MYAHSLWPTLLLLQKVIYFDACLLKDSAERTFRHIAGMGGTGGIAASGWIAPDFMTARRLPVELKAQLLYALHDLPVAETGEPPH